MAIDSIFKEMPLGLTEIRLAKMTVEEREGVSYSKITIEDVSTFNKDANTEIFAKKGIGFRRGES